MNALEIDLLEIKRWLKRGDILEIAKAVGVDPSYASLVLGGHAKHFGVIEQALDKAIERKSVITGKMEKLKQL